MTETTPSLNTAAANTMDIHDVLAHLPHRYPFLLVDKVLDYQPNQYLVGVKNVTFNEPCFTGHFPHRPVFPGVLILEAMAQCTGILAFKSTNEMPNDHSAYYFVGVDGARFRDPVEPGDQLVMRVEVRKQKRGIWVFGATATVDGKVVCEAELMCTKKEF